MVILSRSMDLELVNSGAHHAASQQFRHFQRKPKTTLASAILQRTILQVSLHQCLMLWSQRIP